jgi:MFS family permease
VSWDLFGRLSVMMFLEYAIWGAWAPVLASRLLGPLKMNGKQTGWIYATLPLACIVSPLVAGPMADRWFPADQILAIAHLVGAVLLFVAVRQTKFVPLFVTMLLYSLCYAATLPLVNSLMFTQLRAAGVDVGAECPKIFLWAPVAWALVGYSLTGWRQIMGENEGRDCLSLAGILSAVMALTCFFYLIPTPPAGGATGMPVTEALAALATPFWLLLGLSLVVGGLMQFYFLGTAQFMQDMGISSKIVPGAMAFAQAVQAVATYFALGYLTTKIGFPWTLTIGASCWLLMYLVYIAAKPRWLIFVSQSLHGLAYVLFIIAGQLFADTLAPESVRNSIQSLIFAATNGVGLFLSTQAAGVVMDMCSVEGKFQWRKIWMVPGTVTALGVAALLVWAVAL